MSTDPSGIPPDLPPDVLSRIPLFAELQKVLSWAGGPVNWDLARQVAVASAASAGAGTGGGSSDLGEDARVAHLWMTQATGLADGLPTATVTAVSAVEWAEAACTDYRELVDPLAAKVASAISEQASGAIGEELPDGVDAGAIQMALKQMAPLFLGVQTGGVIGSVAKDVLGSRDVPLPAGDGGPLLVVVSNVERFAGEYMLDAREATLWVVLHETAHRALEETLPAFRPAFFARFHDYVASLSIDFTSAFERLQGIDFTDPTGLEQQLGSQGFFDLLDSPGSREAAGRLEHLIALAEAYADRVADAAAEGRLPSAARIAEAAARHRSGSDGAAALRTFMGVGASEERRRAADRFARAVLDASGWGALNRMWEESETMPTLEEIQDPHAWLGRIR